MRISDVLFTMLMGVAMPSPLLAQATQPDPQQIADMQARAAQQMKPAEFVLQYRTDLGLTAPQVAALELLAVAQRDSARARQARARDRGGPPGGRQRAHARPSCTVAAHSGG